MNKITNERIVIALKRVPERKFRITELAPQLIDESGNPDVLKMMDKQPEVNLALAELQGYIKDVKEIEHMLSKLGRRRLWGLEEDIVEEDE